MVHEKLEKVIAPDFSLQPSPQPAFTCPKFAVKFLLLPLRFLRLFAAKIRLRLCGPIILSSSAHSWVSFCKIIQIPSAFTCEICGKTLPASFAIFAPLCGKELEPRRVNGRIA
jgi:hypothetical protein